MDRIVYLLKFRDIEVNEICLKKFGRLFTAQRAAKDMAQDNNIQLICLDKYNCHTLQRDTIERYGKEL